MSYLSFGTEIRGKTETQVNWLLQPYKLIINQQPQNMLSYCRVRIHCFCPLRTQKFMKVIVPDKNNWRKRNFIPTTSIQ